MVRVVSDTQQEQFIKTHPGQVWRHPQTKELLVSIAAPEMKEPKEVSRDRLAEGVRQCFRGSPSTLEGLIEQCYLHPLLMIEADIPGMRMKIGRVQYGLVLDT